MRGISHRRNVNLRRRRDVNFKFVIFFKSLFYDFRNITNLFAFVKLFLRMRGGKNQCMRIQASSARPSGRMPQGWAVKSETADIRFGLSVHDFFHPDRIVVGANTEKAKAVIKELYKPFEGKTNMLFVKRRSSETIKYASNAFLAIKIHYINEMANFCEKSGADISEVAQGMGLDTRIGNRFLNPGPGYGGSCFPKDTMAMAYMARQNEVEMSLITAAIKGNAERKKQMAGRILDKIKDVKKPKIAVLGLAFKDGTDDCRESPAMDIVGELLQKGADITAYDPKAMGTACGLLGNKISYADDMYACLKDADVLAILTEWNEFKALDLAQAAHLMRHKQIVDCRNLINAEQAAANGFTYQGIGK